MTRIRAPNHTQTHNQKSTIVAVDMDGVLADYVLEFMRRWEKQYPEYPLNSEATQTHHDLEDQYPEHKKRIWSITSSNDFFHAMPAIDRAIEGLLTLDNYYNGRVYICTAPSIHNLQCVPGKYAWIKHHLEQEWMRKTHFIKDKTLARATYLFDDKAHITGIMQPTWQHIRHAQPYNRNTKPRITWKEVIDYGGDLESLLEDKREITQSSSRPASFLCS